MTEAKHTPTPWYGETTSGGQFAISSENTGKTVAVVYTDASDADLIVRAVNSHAALVAALEAVMQCASGEIERPLTERSGWSRAESLIRFALAGARYWANLNKGRAL